MTKIEQTRFREVLKKRQADLEETSNNNRQALSIEVSADKLDRIQQAQERDFALGGLDRTDKLLREVRAAINRLDASTFGICLDCDKDIGMKRLLAMPWTASCIVCQEAAELANQSWSGADELLLANAD